MIIEPLTEKTLNQAIQLVISIFNCKPNDFDYPGKWMPASLAKIKDKEIFNSIKCTYVKYYVAINEETNEVIGTTGIYTQSDDEKDSAWIAWYCINSSFRGKGYGKELLKFTINLAKKMNKRYLKLYTSYNSDIKKAMTLYEKFGFIIDKTEVHLDTKEEMIYLKLKLS